MKQDWVCPTELILTLVEISPDLKHLYDCLNTTYGISIKWIAVWHMDIPKNNGTNRTKYIKFYKSIANYSLFVVSMLTSTEISSTATQHIATCMYSSKLQLQKEVDIVRLVLDFSVFHIAT